VLIQERLCFICSFVCSCNPSLMHSFIYYASMHLDNSSKYTDIKNTKSTSTQSLVDEVIASNMGSITTKACMSHCGMGPGKLTNIDSVLPNSLLF